MTPLFEARSVSKRFGGLTALNQVDYALDSGIASIIGPNGAGKTTLFNVFTGLYTPDAGTVVFRGRSLVVYYSFQPDSGTHTAWMSRVRWHRLGSRVH